MIWGQSYIHEWFELSYRGKSNDRVHRLTLEQKKNGRHSGHSLGAASTVWLSVRLCLPVSVYKKNNEVGVQQLLTQNPQSCGSYRRSLGWFEPWLEELVNKKRQCMGGWITCDGKTEWGCVSMCLVSIGDVTAAKQIHVVLLKNVSLWEELSHSSKKMLWRSRLQAKIEYIITKRVHENIHPSIHFLNPLNVFGVTGLQESILATDGQRQGAPSMV